MNKLTGLGPVSADFYPLDKITLQDVRVMHSVFIKYYENADYETFTRDLKKKIGAILVKRVDDDAIVGFTTIGIVEKEIDRKKCTAIFSGDTVIEKEYWGLPNLQTAFLTFLIKTRIQHPFANLYWFLISKGYKTYLLMANNFTDNYYPRCGAKEDEKRKAVVRAFSNHLFAGFYDERSGLLKFGDSYQRLKDNIAEITDELRQKYPKIAFFEEMNPTWKEGTELPCIGELTWSFLLWVPFPFAYRKILKLFRSGFRKMVKKLTPDAAVTP